MSSWGTSQNMVEPFDERKALRITIPPRSVMVAPARTTARLRVRERTHRHNQEELKSVGDVSCGQPLTSIRH